MKQLSGTLIASLDQQAYDEGVFPALGAVLSELRGRPVILKRAAFPIGTASGLWLDLPEMDIVAVCEDTANSEHEHVILGHEIWHMFEGHCAAHTAAGGAAARAHHTTAVDDVVHALLATRDDRLSDLGQLRYVARTDFDDSHEAEAEMFGLHFATHVRHAQQMRRRADRQQVAGRIEDSMSSGPCVCRSPWV
ncbi:toxin-antitoxin system, toxin component [Streptomyces odontomachi]|uniref:toxin-antitoxin system, toxin component n=1 Tax=Streptomyces odontomachi TaxID=2944940 RepID=UPI00210CDE55|nr:toxin-antitoxin system, toxin component [Streptomyces sp. ODS25]